MQKLLIVSDAPSLFSGQARVVREFARRFLDFGVQVVVAGWFLDAAEEPDVPFPYPVVLAHKLHPETLEATIKDFQPDTVLAIGDPWDFTWLSAYRSQNPRFRLFGHLNIEAELPTSMERVLDGFDGIVTTSEYGRQQVGRSRAIAIHYGVDMKVFRPLDPPEVFLGKPKAETFVVLINSQNTHRKNLPVAVQAFTTFAKGKSNVLCYMNCTIKPENGFDLYDQIVRAEAERLFFFNPGNHGPHATVNDESMNQIYSAADCLLITSCAEGFGLPVLEAMATRTLVIAPDAYSMSELVSTNRGVLYPVAAGFMGAAGAMVVMPGHEEITEALEGAYRAWETRTEPSWWFKYINLAQAFAMSKTWDVSFKKLQIFMETSAKPQRSLESGAPIDGLSRIRARKLASRHKATGVLKMGGLGDMLQATRVLRTCHEKTGERFVVFCNNHPDVFRQLPEVDEVVIVAGGAQDQAVRSVAPAFERFIDIRYVSMRYEAFGNPQPSAYALRYRAYYDFWTQVNSRIAVLGHHTTKIMLSSLELNSETITPVYTLREDPPPLPQNYVVIATGPRESLKSWPGLRWREFVATIDRPAVQVGAKTDPWVEGAVDMRGLSIPVTASILELANGMLAVEGGIVHLAAAVGLRSSVIFGPTPIVSFGYPTNQNFGSQNCPPCFWHEGWAHAICSMGAGSCMNFPEVQETLKWA